MIHRIRILFSIGIALLILIASMETTNAQVVYGGRTYVNVPNGAPYFLGRSWQRSRYWVGRPRAKYPSYTTYVRVPYVPPSGTHYYPYQSYYYVPYRVQPRIQYNYRYR
jgi:hypothetical protein